MFSGKNLKSIINAARAVKSRNYLSTKFPQLTSSGNFFPRALSAVPSKNSVAFQLKNHSVVITTSTELAQVEKNLKDLSNIELSYLKAKCRSSDSEIPENIQIKFKKKGLINAAGHIPPTTREIILSAVSESDDKMVVSSALDLDEQTSFRRSMP